MPLTTEQRAEINRRNAAKSTGPKSDEGKASSRQNALKHGLRAEALALPNEDPTVVAARSDAWNEYYRPQSPAAQHLVNACVSATLLSDRCQKFHEAALTQQIRDAEDAWEIERGMAVENAVAMLKTDPGTAVWRLGRTGHGCRWLIGRWEKLSEALDHRGQWSSLERDEAIRLQGFNVNEETIKELPAAWQITLFGFLCYETPSAVGLVWLFQPDHQPEITRLDYQLDNLPGREECQRELRQMAADELARLRAAEATHRVFCDEPERAAMVDRALILHDGPMARLFLRYHSEARTSFHRAYGSLVKALELDAAGGPAPSPNEADFAPVSTPVEALSPIEANSEPEPEETEPSSSSQDLVLPVATSGWVVSTGSRKNRKGLSVAEMVVRGFPNG